jgi:hypothetical protein
MNSVFSAFKLNKNCPSGSSKEKSGVDKTVPRKTLSSNETNNYEKLRHIREKMSNFKLDSVEINLQKPPSIPTLDECEPLYVCSKFDPANTLSSEQHVMRNFSSSSSPSLNTIPHTSIEKYYDQDDSESYASENNLCCNGAETKNCVKKVLAKSTSDVKCSSSATNFDTNSSSSIIDSTDASKPTLKTCNTSVPNSNSNANRNRPRLSLSNIASNSQQPEVHGKNCPNGTSTGRTRLSTRLSTHQRNLSLDFR